MADVKISELTAAEAATSDDLVVIVDDPAGTPSTKKLTISELATAVAGDKLPLAGGTMTGAIVFGTGGQNLNVGSFDNSTSGYNGISLTCAVGYELNWQGGHLSSSASAGATNYDILCDSSITLAAGKRLTFGDATYIETAPAVDTPAVVEGTGGAGSAVAGSTNVASGSESAAICGNTNTSSGTGSAVAGGLENTASGEYSGVIGGKQAIATAQHSRALSSGKFGTSGAVAGTAQMMEFVLRQITTSASSSSLTFDANPTQGATNCAVIAVKSTWAFTVKVAAYSVTSNVGAAWTITGALRRDAAGTVAIVGTNTTVTVTEAAISTATCVVVADDTNKAIKITATGVASNTIRWCAHVVVTQAIA